MTTNQTQEEFLQESAAALTAKLEAWVAHLPPREQQLLALALSRAPAGREDVHGHGGAAGGVVLRSGSLADVVNRFLAPQGAPRGSTLDISPYGSKPGLSVGNGY